MHQVTYINAVEEVSFESLTQKICESDKKQTISIFCLLFKNYINSQFARFQEVSLYVFDSLAIFVT